jgi:hypothetical protein
MIRKAGEHAAIMRTTPPDVMLLLGTGQIKPSAINYRENAFDIGLTASDGAFVCHEIHNPCWGKTRLAATRTAGKFSQHHKAVRRVSDCCHTRKLDDPVTEGWLTVAKKVSARRLV